MKPYLYLCRKRKNKMTPGWEEGVKDFMWAFRELRQSRPSWRGISFKPNRLGRIADPAGGHGCFGYSA